MSPIYMLGIDFRWNIKKKGHTVDGIEKKETSQVMCIIYYAVDLSVYV